MNPDLAFARDALILDIDGTLIEIAPTPENVVVPPELKHTLAALGPLLGGALAFCSGRTLAAVDRLFAPLALAAIGDHGAQIRPAPGAPVEAMSAPIPEDVKRDFADVEQRFPGVHIEDKTYTLAFHYRAAPQFEAPLLDLVSGRLRHLPGGLVVLRGKAIVEIKSGGFDKGTGLRALMAHAPFRGRRPVFLGDDRTDEDVMAVLKDFRGIGYSVGTLLEGASGEFRAPADVRAWLAGMTPVEA
ncbi:MAG TPA: trehalose-phosphatase [Rhizomicrobium sp.]|nr:trehalose-phosphatase [Rhizomicrobium sp.]